MNNYIPFLKLKSNEVLAIKELKNEIKKWVTPFFDIPKNTGDLSEADFIKKTSTMVASVKRHLNDIPNFYLDNFDIDSNLKINGINNYKYLLDSFSDFHFIPIVSIDRCEEHIEAVCDAKNAGAIHSDVIGIRLVPDDFENFAAVADEIDDMLGDVFNAFDGIDLIFDCRVCLGQNLNKLSLNISNFAKDFSKSYPIRKLIVAGSSIPASISDIAKVESAVELQRAELRLFNYVGMELDELFNLVLGDYGIVSPNYSDLDIIPEAMQNVTAPKILYAYDNNHFIVRGGALRTHPRGFAQYFDLAEILVAKEFFRGSDYSYGDRFLEEKSNGAGKNVTPSSIIKPTVNAHISFMLKDYEHDFVC